MRVILAITAIVLAMALLGWVTFSGDDGGASIRVDTDEAARDVDHAADETGRAVDRAFDTDRDPSRD